LLIFSIETALKALAENEKSAQGGDKLGHPLYLKEEGAPSRKQEAKG